MWGEKQRISYTSLSEEIPGALRRLRAASAIIFRTYKRFLFWVKVVEEHTLNYALWRSLATKDEWELCCI